MDTLIKEYGGLVLSLIGAALAFTLLTLSVSSWKDNSKKIIMNITGVSQEDAQYVNEVFK